MADDASPSPFEPCKLAVALLVLAIAACALVGCTGSKGAVSSSTGPIGPPAASCAGLTADRVARIAGMAAVNSRPIAPAPGSRQRCAVAFFDGAGGLVLLVRARTGSPADLRKAAALAAGAGGVTAERVRPLSGLGDGAFISGRRLIGFRHAGQVVTVETGYSSSGQLSLDVHRLVALARAAAAGTG